MNTADLNLFSSLISLSSFNLTAALALAQAMAAASAGGGGSGSTGSAGGSTASGSGSGGLTLFVPTDAAIHGWLDPQNLSQQQLLDAGG